MPQLPPDTDDETTDPRSHLSDFAADARRRASSFWDSFSNFALRDNVLEVAVGLIFATSFTTLTTSFVSDILLPLLSLLPFISHSLPDVFLVLRRGVLYSQHKIPRYNTVEQGLDDGAVLWAYGRFLDAVLRFVLVALSLFLIAKAYEWVSKDKVVKRQVKCRYCRKYISEKARRCVNCTSWLDGREDK
ncbi:large-conductance mechanosensitive channel [Elsinoe ampelina]|uniref:Large-conductance mechanosensitive channel n=1 Tax=Elsinoe ampelina TaxID=302913 RepID=A0A6A6GQ43_9PEZI|nr:large-conductance mechanosensitive channel [Elsinoe ampelina]